MASAQFYHRLKPRVARMERSEIRGSRSRMSRRPYGLHTLPACLSAAPDRQRRMILKLIALAAAAIPAYLFWRAMFGKRPSKVSAAWGEAKKQIDLAIYIFLGLVGCVVAVALGKIIWTWWTAV